MTDRAKFVQLTSAMAVDAEGDEREQLYALDADGLVWWFVWRDRTWELLEERGRDDGHLQLKVFLRKLDKLQSRTDVTNLDLEQLADLLTKKWDSHTLEKLKEFALALVLEVRAVRAGRP